MPSNWIFTISAENWPRLKSAKKFATNTEGKANKLRVGDRLLIDVSGTHSFRGAFQVKGPWKKATKPRNPDEIEQHKVLYPYEFDVKSIATGVADIRKLKTTLYFISALKDPHYGVLFQSNPGNKGRPISDSDYQTVLKELHGNPEPSGPIISPAAKKPGIVSRHGYLIDEIVDMGEVFGFRSLKSPPISRLRPAHGRAKSVDKQHDVAWEIFSGVWIPIEVQVHGSIPDLFDRFNKVHQWSHRLVVVADEAQHEEIRETAEEYPFREKVIILTEQEVVRASRDLQEMKNLRKKIFES